MAKKRKRKARAPQTPPDALKAQEASITPADGIAAQRPAYVPPAYFQLDDDYWADPELPRQLAQDWNRKYGPGPDGRVKLLINFTSHIHKYSLKPVWMRVWADHPANAIERNSRWDLASKDRSWLRGTLDQIKPLARKHSIDERPLLWFFRYIHGLEILSDINKQAIIDLLHLLLEAEVRERDAGGGWLLLGDGERAILTALKMSKGRPLTQDDIAEATLSPGFPLPAISRGTIGKLLEPMRKAGWVSHPPGKKKRECITDLGRKALSDE